MMLKCSVLACLLAIAVAQTPNRPVFKSTFFASGEMELHTAEKTDFGKFKMARDQVAMKSVEENSFDEKGDVEEMLQRYDQKKTYYIRGMGEDKHCIEIDRNGTLAPFWGWLDFAVYQGERTVHERDHYLWGTTVGDIYFEVGVDKETPNAPVFFNRESAEDFVYFHFMMYNETTPASTYFDVPADCNRKK